MPLQKYLAGVVVTPAKIQQAKKLYAMHFGSDTIFNEAGLFALPCMSPSVMHMFLVCTARMDGRVIGLTSCPGWMYIVEHHGGKLPLRIMAVDEGTVVPVKNGMYVRYFFVRLSLVAVRDHRLLTLSLLLMDVLSC